MPKVDVYDVNGQVVGEEELTEEIFGAPVNHALLHQAIRVYLANRRAGTASTRTRGEVRGGGRKPWRQKGTGRARHGSIRSPIWRGGGVVFGPKPRSHRLLMPKKARRQALRSALSAKLRDGELTVLDRLELPELKTKAVAQVLERLAGGRKPLLVIPEPDAGVRRAARNLPGVRTVVASCLNTYEVLDSSRVLLTRDAVRKVEEVLRPHASVRRDQAAGGD
ncbi:50S ribosomal protein L4 [Limnochorda pilosa]|uniref:Large ribosomal subunit protein uL4 n=1 Tax=Limnochorda pilosa TaxID=1555112 RepID=A0A0K2SPZ7_LIMPI|nr:50S ribosomal protein L4 [Limnochorda pilosa]BAS29087.1 50S ribosomal protein L4 [Limnochorda pilosa]